MCLELLPGGNSYYTLYLDAKAALAHFRDTRQNNLEAARWIDRVLSKCRKLNKEAGTVGNGHHMLKLESCQELVSEGEGVGAILLPVYH